MDFFVWLEIAGVAIGLLYLYLEYNVNIWLWPVGIVMPAIYIFVYYNGGFYADFGLSIYYLIAGIYGWTMWLFRKDNSKPKPIRSISTKVILPLIIVFIFAFVVIAYILINYTDSTVPYGDSFTTALSIVGLWMLAHKYVEQWLVWIAVDVVSSVLYVQKELYPTAGLYALYSIIAVAGYYKWKSLRDSEEKKECNV